LLSGRERLRQRPFASVRIADAIARLPVTIAMGPIAPALQLVLNRNLALLVDAIAMLEAHVPFVHRLVRRRAAREEHSYEPQSEA